MAAGRPTLYKTKYCEQVATMCANGATDQELADFLGVHIACIYRWAAKYEEFSKALKAGKELADERVERSLYSRAVGFEHVSVKIFMPAGAEEPVYAKYREYLPPDVGAASMWLKNRRGDKWRDKSQSDLNINVSWASIVEEVAAKRLAEAKTIEGEIVDETENKG